MVLQMVMATETKISVQIMEISTETLIKAPFTVTQTAIKILVQEMEILMGITIPITVLLMVMEMAMTIMGQRMET